MEVVDLHSNCRPGGFEKPIAGILCVLAMSLTIAWPACRVKAEASSADDADLLETKTLEVSSFADSGPGSLRAALEQASESSRTYRIGFGSADGPFSVPRVIEIASPLPVIQTEVEIDGYISGLLWKAYGATVSGNGQFRIFEIAPSGVLHLGGITVENGRADSGGGILNHGRLVVQGVTFLENHAEHAGGAIANQGGEAFMINSTAYANRASKGGAVANLAGSLRLTNVTLHQNHAEIGSAVFNRDQLVLNNSILTGEAMQCVNRGALVESRHNLFAASEGCGEAIIYSNPHLGTLNYYNGPTRTIPISALSPARNLADNAAAVDHAGNPLKWDQRGNGDPRFARGFVDIGAFEHQSQLPDEHVVDTLEDTILRGCTQIGEGDCPLRAAVELSLSGRSLVPVRFDPEVFSGPQEFRLERLPENADQPLIIDGEGTGGITVIVPEFVPWKGVNEARIELSDPNTNAARN
jgi:predicted outer membrane repeat protein